MVSVVLAILRHDGHVVGVLSRTCRPACALAISFASPTSTAASSWAAGPLAGDAGVGEREALGNIAHERARELELRAEAHFVERGWLELGEKQIGMRFHRRVPRFAALPLSFPTLSGSPVRAVAWFDRDY